MPFSCTDCDPARNLIIVKDSPIMNEFTINYILQLSPSLNNVTHESTYCEYLIIKSLSTKTNVCEYYKYKYLHSANVFCAIFICYYIKVLIELFLYFDCEFKPNMSIYSTIVSLSYEMKHKMLNTADEERPYKRSECEKTLEDNCQHIIVTKVPYTKYSHTVECIPYQCSNAKVIHNNIIFLILLMHTDEKPHKCNELYHLYFDICRYCCTEMKLLYKLNYSLLKSNICLQSAFKSSLYKTKYHTEDRPYVRTKCDRDFSSIQCMSDICNTIFIKVPNTKYYHSVECIPYNCIKVQIIKEYIVFLILLIHTEEKPYKCNELYQTNLLIYSDKWNYISISKPTNANLCTSSVKSVTYRSIKLLYLEKLNRIVIKPFSCTDCDHQDTSHVTRIMIYEILHMILRPFLLKATRGE